MITRLPVSAICQFAAVLAAPLAARPAQAFLSVRNVRMRERQ